jgi:hypothetical protein
MGHILDCSPDSVTFADLFGSDQEAQAEYVKGLIGLGSFFLGWVVVWFLLLLALQSKWDAGCASRRAFQTIIIEEDSDQTDTFSSSDEDSRADTFPPSTESDNEENECDTPNHNQESSDPETPSSTLATVHLYPYPLEDEDKSIHFPVTIEEIKDTPLEKPLAWSTPKRNRIRQKRTRIVYLLFSFLSFLCCCLLLRKTYQPIQDAAANIGDVITQGRFIVYQTASVVENVTATADGAKQVIDDDLPLNVTGNSKILRPNKTKIRLVKK